MPRASISLTCAGRLWGPEAGSSRAPPTAKFVPPSEDGARARPSLLARCSTQTGPFEKRPALPVSERLSPITTIRSNGLDCSAWAANDIPDMVIVQTQTAMRKRLERITGNLRARVMFQGREGCDGWPAPARPGRHLVLHAV